ncbi:hypothetical protein AVEN_192489-1 [Araneus ventricosus]|uniref:Uncharacterized protein n=1 Tax=Araneus ventricosus TaxID=182803 RepID=A0A4Y2RCI7_ARAVE|nr:hypothetical protein AVEN_192489-1 [Araneus ventricosus]
MSSTLTYLQCMPGFTISRGHLSMGRRSSYSAALFVSLWILIPQRWIDRISISSTDYVTINMQFHNSRRCPLSQVALSILRPALLFAEFWIQHSPAVDGQGSVIYFDMLQCVQFHEKFRRCHLFNRWLLHANACVVSPLDAAFPSSVGGMMSSTDMCGVCGSQFPKVSS